MTAELQPAQQRIEHRSETLGYARKRVGQKAGNSRKEEEEERNREEEAEERREGWGCVCVTEDKEAGLKGAPATKYGTI